MPRVQYHHHDMEHFATTFRPYHHHHQHHSSVLQRLAIEPHFLTATAVLQQQLQYLQYSEPAPLDLNYPLDLSVKTQYHHQNTTITIPEIKSTTNSTPITPPSTPSPSSKRCSSATSTPEQPTKKAKTSHGTPGAKKSKASRKLNFEEDNSSPVSGTIIRELRPDETLVVRKGDIDPAFNVVEVTEEAKAELAKIENVIGEYVCRLCRELYEDAFGLAQHRCTRIVHVEYRCPECDKVFNCPANLASHRRWHKPRPVNNNNNNSHKAKDANNGGGGGGMELEAAAGEEEIVNEEQQNATQQPQHFPCGECGKKFRRVAYLRKHQTVHQQQMD